MSRPLQEIIAEATPGPWVYEYTRLGHTVRQPGQPYAIMVVNHAENPEADGRLMAMAPDLAARVAALEAERDAWKAMWQQAETDIKAERAIP